MGGLNFSSAKNALKNINPTKILTDVTSTVNEYTRGAIEDVESNYGQSSIDAIADGATKKVEEALGNPSDVVEGVQDAVETLKNPQSLIDEVQSAVEDAKSIADTLKSGKLTDTKQIESFENKMNNISDVANKVGSIAETYSSAKEMIGTAKDAIESPGDFVKDKIKDIILESDYVQNLKDAIIEKLKEEVMEIPEISDIVNQAKSVIEELKPSMEMPSDISNMANNPEKFLDEMPSIDAMVVRAIRESGIGRSLLATDANGSE